MCLFLGFAFGFLLCSGSESAMTKAKIVVSGLLTLIVAPIFLHFWLIHFHIPGWKPIYESTSPNGRFTVSLYSNPGLSLIRFFHMSMPGQGGASQKAGTIILKDNSTGKVWQRGQVDYLAPYGTIDWEPDSVGVGRGDGSFNWDLPPEKPTK